MVNKKARLSCNKGKILMDFFLLHITSKVEGTNLKQL
jgi:hypothetical protein